MIPDNPEVSGRLPTHDQNQIARDPFIMCLDGASVQLTVTVGPVLRSANEGIPAVSWTAAVEMPTTAS